MTDALYLVKKIYFVNEGESLSGYVQGKPASDIEERSALAISKLQIPFTFQARLNPLVGLTSVKMNIKGELEIDFLCEYKNVMYPILINGEISHYYAAWMKERDANKLIRIDTALAPFKPHKTIVVPFTLLRTQEDADRLFRYNFLNGFPTEFSQP